MGSLSGHVIPGVFFLSFGLWWAWAFFHKLLYFHTKSISGSDKTSTPTPYKRRVCKGKGVYQNTASFHCPKMKNFPVEGYLKLLLTSLGIVGEVVTAFEDGHLKNRGNLQHVAMYFFFGLNGAVDVIRFHCNYSLIGDLDYATGFLAYSVEGVLFVHHLNGQTVIEKELHVFLIYLVICSALSILAESFRKNEPIFALGRIYFNILQGTWFLQIGICLYVFNWIAELDLENHQLLSLVSTLFSCHMGAIALFLLIFGHIIGWRNDGSGITNTFEYSLIHATGTATTARENASVEAVVLTKAGSSDSDEP